MGDNAMASEPPHADLMQNGVQQPVQPVAQPETPPMQFGEAETAELAPGSTPPQPAAATPPAATPAAAPSSAPAISPPTSAGPAAHYRWPRFCMNTFDCDLFGKFVTRLWQM